MNNEIAVLSFGGGQDSTAILLLFLMNEQVKQKYLGNKRMIVVMADTGNEHDYTYKHVENAEKLCHQYGVEFHLLTKDKGYHTQSWPDLITPQMREEGDKYKASMVQLGQKSCTLNLKVGPIYKFLDEYINEMMGYNFKIRSTRGTGKQAIKKYHQEVGDIPVFIGYAKGEERRAEKSMKLEKKQKESKGDSWEKALTRYYPLIDLGYDRQMCQELIKEKLGYEVMPSNCMLCPYQNDAEILWLYKNRPDQFELWVEIERRKLARGEAEGTEKNHGVYNSKKTLMDKLRAAQEKFGEWTEEQLNHYKMNHGCQSNAM